MRFIDGLCEGETIRNVYLCKGKRSAETRNGKPYDNLILQDKKYSYLFTVEEVNDRVAAGIPFREAYRMVAEKVQLGEYRGDISRPLHHTHEGSIGNLCLQQIREKFERHSSEWKPEQVWRAEAELME